MSRKALWHRKEYWRDHAGIRLRLCKPCKKWLPHTSEYFCLEGKRGLGTVCKDCRNFKTRKWKANGRPRTPRIAQFIPVDTRYWNVPGVDQEAINLLHKATERWPTTDEGRAWPGR